MTIPTHDHRVGACKFTTQGVRRPDPVPNSQGKERNKKKEGTMPENTPFSSAILERIKREFPDPVRRARVKAMLTGTVFPDEKPIDPELAERLDAHENVREAVENYCFDFYDRKYGINQAYLGYGIILRLRQIAANAMAAYDKAFISPPGVKTPFGVTHDNRNPFIIGEYELDDFDRLRRIGPKEWNSNEEIIPLAVAAHRPGERWLIRGKQTFETVAESISKDVACELEIYRGCSDTTPNTYRDKYGEWEIKSAKTPSMTFPFPYGDFVVFAKICHQCWTAFKTRYEIGECRIDSTFDGLG
jgi:hypothetical protein